MGTYTPIIFALWALSFLAIILEVFPGPSKSASIKVRSFRKATSKKFIWLRLSIGLFRRQIRLSILRMVVQLIARLLGWLGRSPENHVSWYVATMDGTIGTNIQIHKIVELTPSLSRSLRTTIKRRSGKLST